MIWGLTWYLLVGWLILLASDWHGWCLAGPFFQLAGFSWLWLTLANSGCNGWIGWKSAIIDFLSMPVGPHLAHCLAQDGLHFHVDLMFNLGIIWGVRIVYFYCKYYCFCILCRASYVKNKNQRGFHYGARYVKKNLVLYLHYGDKQSQLSSRWLVGQRLLACWLLPAAAWLVAGRLAVWLLTNRWLARGLCCCQPLILGFSGGRSSPERVQHIYEMIRLRIKESPTKTNELRSNLKLTSKLFPWCLKAALSSCIDTKILHEAPVRIIQTNLLRICRREKTMVFIWPSTLSNRVPTPYFVVFLRVVTRQR